MIVCIPSYKRAGKVKTFELLGGAFTKDEVIIATQTESDYEEYTKLYGEQATIILAEAHSCGEARNNLLDYCEGKGIKEVLFLDDDLKKIRTVDDRFLVGVEFRDLMDKCFQFAHKNSITLFGSYATDNPMMMSRKAVPNIIDGMLCGLLDTSIRYDKSFTTKSDYELSLRLMSHGKRVIRFNSFAPVNSPRSSGGCEEIRQRKEEYLFVAQCLVDAYPNLIAMHPNKKGEIKYIGK